MTHSSASSTASNERLEFLGDRVLGLVIAQQLHASYPDEAEGELTRKLHALVRWETCARVGEAAKLWDDLTISLSVSDAHGRSRATILGSACEAVIAALYLDGGLDAARRFVECYWRDEFSLLGQELRDAKSRLQEWSQARNGKLPVYRLVKSEGPQHAPRFVIEVLVAGHDPVQGEGGSKRDAEQEAARQLLEKVAP